MQRDEKGTLSVCVLITSSKCARSSFLLHCTPLLPSARRKRAQPSFYLQTNMPLQNRVETDKRITLKSYFVSKIVS